MKKTICIVLIFSSFLLFTGCASYRTTGGFPSKDISAYQSKQEKNGVSMVAKFYNQEETYKMFQRNIQGRGIHPVFIIIENKSANTYFLDKDKCSKLIIPANEAAERCRFSPGARTFWYYLLCVIPAVIDGMGSAEANEMMRKDYVNKELNYYDKILPDKTVAGFLYLDKIDSGEELIIKLDNIDTKETISFNFRKP